MTPEQTLDWLAEQHKSQCNEDRPVQEWIRSMKLVLPAPVQKPSNAQIALLYPWMRPADAKELLTQILALGTPAPVQEPFGYVDPDELSADDALRWCKIGKHTTPVYTTPPAQPAPTVQEPVAIYQYQTASGAWVDQEKHSYDYNVRHGQATVRVVYTTPPAQPAPVQEPVADVYMAGSMKTNIGTNGRVVYVSTVYSEKPLAKGEKLYTTPPAQPAPVPLMDEMRKQMKERCDSMEKRGAFADGWLSAESAHGITKGQP